MFARARLRQLLGEKFRRRHADELEGWLRAELPSLPTTPPRDYLNLPDGLLDWRTGVLSPHTPQHPSTIRIPVRWNPEATCPRIEAFLLDVFAPPDDELGKMEPAERKQAMKSLEQTLQLVFELCGYCLTPTMLLHVAVLLLGPGRNGKSTLLAVLRALLGAANVSTVALQQFSERFQVASLYGKLANICGDLDARAVERTDIFKAMTGGDPIQGEWKYLPPFTFTSFALPLFSANEATLSRDQSEAWFSRWIVLSMPKIIPKEKRDPALVAKLTTRPELEGLLVQAVAGLRRLLDRGRFELPQQVEEAGQAYREELDTVEGWLQECVELDPQTTTSREFLYLSYCGWCQRTGHKFPLRASALRPPPPPPGAPGAQERPDPRVPGHAPPRDGDGRDGPCGQVSRAGRAGRTPFITSSYARV